MMICGTYFFNKFTFTEGKNHMNWSQKGHLCSAVAADGDKNIRGRSLMCDEQQSGQSSEI